MLDYLVQETGKVFHFQGEGRGILYRGVRSHDMISKHILMDVESPRWEQLFSYTTQAANEAELDSVLEEMTLDGYVERITCPTLLATGEYDPRSPIEEVYEVFDRFAAPTELWVFADQHHIPADGGVNWSASLHGVMCDWLWDRFNGKPVAHPGQVVYVEDGSAGPNSASAPLKRRWYG